jgi:hypothetical protein
MAFAGLWESFRRPDQTVTRSFVIMTAAPNAEMEELHDRMPVILEEQDGPVWLGGLKATGRHCFGRRQMGYCESGRSIGVWGRRGTMDRGFWRASPHSTSAQRF